MQWRLKDVFDSGIDQRSLAKELINAGEHKTGQWEALAKKLNQIRHENQFFKLRNPINFYILLRNWLDATPRDLTTAKTDEDAIIWILNKKLEQTGVKGVKVTAIELDEDLFTPVSEEVRSRFMDRKPLEDLK